MKKMLLIVFGVVILSIGLMAQDGSVWVKGRVIDGISGKPIVSARVANHYAEKGVYSNLNGEFQLLVDKDHLLRFRALGYDSKSVSFFSQDEETKELVISLVPHSFYLEDVTVIGLRPSDDNLENTSFPWLTKKDYAYSIYDGAPVIIDSDLRLMNKKERALRKYQDEFERVK